MKVCASRLALFSLLAVVLGGSLACAQAAAPSDGKLRPQLVLQLGHNKQVHSVAFSPDGKQLASGSADNTIKLWDVTNGTLIRTLTGHLGGGVSVAFSPDGRRLASGGGDKTIKLWDVASGQLIRTMTGHKLSVDSVAFSRDGKLLASGSEDKTIKLWNVANGQLIRSLTGHNSWVNSVAFSPNGRNVVSGSGNPYGKDNTIKLWDVANGTLIRTLTGHGDDVLSVAFSPDGRQLASGSQDTTIKLWDVATGKLTHTLKGDGDIVNSVAFSLDGRSLVSGSYDNTVKLWDTASGKVIRTFKNGATSYSVAFSPDGRRLASGNYNSTIKLWDVASGNLTGTLAGYGGAIESVAFSPDGRRLASGPPVSGIKLWDVSNGQLIHSMEWGHKSVTFSPDSKTLATASWEDVILWDIASGKQIPFLEVGGVTSVKFSPDGKMLAVVRPDKSIQLWTVASGKLVRNLNNVHDYVFTSVAFSPDGRQLASGSEDKTIKVWDVASGKLIRTLIGHNEWVSSVAFSPDGQSVVSGSWDHTVKLWDVASGKLIHTLTGHSFRVNSVAFSPDGQNVASGSWDNTVKLWNVANGKLIGTLTGHSDCINSVVFSPDGRSLISGSSDNTIKSWNSKTGQERATLMTLPEIAQQTADSAKALSIGAKALTIGAKGIESVDGEWFVTTPEGWFDCSANAAQFIRWRVNNQVVPAERYYRVLRRPDMVQAALRGEAVPEPDLSSLDVPPQAQFTRVQYNDKAANSVTMTLDTQGRRNVKEIILLVNGRPLPPESEAPLQVEDVAVSDDLTARALDVGARPLDIGVRALDIGARPLSIGAKDLQTTGAKRYSVAKRYTFKVPLPIGAPEIKLRAQVYDEKELGSNPTEVVLSRPDAKRVPGNLYILCAGISKYKNGSDGAVETATGFSNLKFSGDDARSVAERLKAEGAPLYEKVEVFNGGPLLDGQANLTNLRAGLKWLQEKARPGQVDTVIIYLSGHGLSDPQGKYYFPTYDFDKANWQATSLSGKELQQELGGKLRARSVFLFVDTCHSGALAGSRSDDLNFDVNSSGVYMLASSGGSQYSYESETWGHGAFTLALLNSLKRKELAPDGTIKFNVLTYAVPDEIAKLMHQIGQSENAMAPVVPLEGRRLDEAVAQVH